MRRYLDDSQLQQADAERHKVRAFVEAGRYYGRSRSSTVLTLGLERESCLVDAAARPAFCGNDIVDAVGEVWLKPEFPRCVVEVNSDTIPGGPMMFDELHRQLVERRRVVSAAAEERGAYLLDCGLLGTFPQSAALADGDRVVSTAQRYRSLLAYLRRRNGEYRVTVNGSAGSLDYHVPASPVPAGLTCGGSPNVGFHPSCIGRAADLSVATAWVFPRVSSSSPFAFERHGLWCSRVPVWQLGMDPERTLSPFGPGRYWRVADAAVIDDWYRYVKSGELVLGFEEAGIDPCKGDLPYLTLLTGTRWVQCGRVRAALVGDELCVYFEHRVMDTALTVNDEIANTAFYVGLMAALLREGVEAEDLMPYEAAAAAFDEVVAHGRADITWRGSRRPALSIILDDLVPAAYAGLVAEGVASRLAQKLIGLVERRLRNRKSAADWLLARASVHTTSRRNEAAAIRAAYKDAVAMQRNQCCSFDRLDGVAEW